MPESAPDQRTSRQLARRLLSYTRPYRAILILSLGLILGTTLLVNYLPVILQRAIDTYLAPGSPLTPGMRFSGLLRMGKLYLVLAALGFLLRLGQGLLTAWMGQSIVRDLRRDVFDKALDLDLSTFDRTPVGKLVTRVSSDTEAVQRFVTEGVVGLVADAFMLLGIAGYMVFLNPRLAAYTALLLPGLIICIERVNRRLRQANRDIRSRQSTLNVCLQESLAGMDTIQLFNREAHAQTRFGQANRDLRGAFFSEVRWFSHFFPLIELGQNGTVALLVGVGGWMVLGGSDVLTVGMLVAFLSYVRSFFWPLGDLSDKASTYQQAVAAAERLFELMDAPGDVPEAQAPLPVGGLQHTLQFQHVWFAYEGENWVLKDFDVTLNRGESVAVVGPTGAGKTTIANLISRLYDVQRGSILIDGHDLRAVRKRDLRSKISVVLQEPFIFSGTVAANIALDNPRVSQADIERAARHVNAHRFIELLPMGYETPLHARGAGLSSGEKQLLAMARALAQDPEILLVLDEATANVDTETETLIQEALHRLMRERTTLAIAHRLSTVRNADRILVMEGGRLKAQGTHRELLLTNTTYRNLYELLSIGRKEPPGINGKA